VSARSVSARRLTSRDYKSSRRGGLNLARWKEYGIGFAAGLAVALVVFIADHRPSDESAASADRPTPRKADADALDTTAARTDAARAATGGANAETTASKFDFYQMLPKFEVVVPEKERGTRVAPTAQVDRPGVYFLQAGSYHEFADADRVRAQLAKQGIDASVQRVQVDTDVWHRVRVGPIRDLNLLNRLRAQLRASDVDSLVVRVGDQ
jgi:cell division protein FtsN